MDRQRLTHFDGLRGVAALAVLISHVLCMYFPATYTGREADTHTAFDLVLYHTPLNIFGNGEFAVCVFFAISGYVLSVGYFRHTDKKKIIPAIAKRYPRLMLPVWLSVLLSFFLQETGAYRLPAAAADTRSLWLEGLFPASGFTDMLKNIGYEQFLHHNTPTPLNPVLWTIATELKGSLLVFAVLLLAPRNRWRFLLYAALFLYYFKGYFMLFIFGLALADISINEMMKPVLNRLTLSAAWVLIIIFGSFRHEAGFIGWHLIEPLARITKPNFIGAMLLVFVVCYHGHTRQWLTGKGCQWLGRISYSLYLFHLILLRCISIPLYALLKQWVSDYVTCVLLVVCISIPLILLICRSLFTPVDEWGIRLANRLGNRVSRVINGE